MTRTCWQPSLQRLSRTTVLGTASAMTPRERDVMGLVTTGLLNKEIAYALGTCEKTIKAHRARVMQKMQAASVAELVRMVTMAGLWQPPAAHRVPTLDRTEGQYV